MTARFTSPQKRQGEKLVGDVITSLNPTKEEMQRVLMSKAFQPRLREVFAALMLRYFTPLSDKEALVWLMKEARQPKADARRLIDSCRKGAIAEGKGSDPCHYATQSGANLKFTIPTLGPCVEDFKYLQDWSFADTLTEHCLVSGVPVALRETTNQNLTEQLQTLRMIEDRWGVPTGFFSRELIQTVYTAGVALAYHNLTKQQMFGDLWVRTGTCDADGYRLELVWGQGRLHCDGWDWGGSRISNLAVAPLGVTRALGH